MTTNHVRVARRTRPPEDFQQAATEHGITRCYERACSICGYVTAYIIDGDNVAFDRGCHCGVGYGIDPRTWQDIADMYNMQNVQTVQQAHDTFWGFDQDDPDDPSNLKPSSRKANPK